MAWGTPYRNDFSDKSEISVYNSETTLGSPSDNKSPIQTPRLRSNVQIVTDASATADSAGRHTLVRVFSRLAGSGEYKGGGYWGNGGFCLTKGIVLYGRYTMRVRGAYGKNTKGVIGLESPKGWNGAAKGSGMEEDIWEWYSTGTGTPDESSGASNLHWREADGTEKPGDQWHIPLGITDWSVWHTIVFTWTPTMMDLTVDGVRPAPVPGNQHSYPITNPLLIPIVPQRLFFQTAMLGQRDVGVTTRTTLQADLDYVIIEPYVDSGVTISDPSNVTLTDIDSLSARATWSPSSASNKGAISYIVEKESPSGAGNWTTVGTPTANAQLIQGLTASTSYRIRVTATSGNLQSNPVVSNAITTPGSGTTINAVLTLTSSGGPANGPAPLLVHVDPTSTTGTITAATFDPGDGSDPIVLSLPLAAFDQPYSSVSPSGGWQASLTVSDGSGNMDTDIEQVIVTSGDDTATDQLGMVYPIQGDPILAQQMIDWLNVIDNAAGGAVQTNEQAQTEGDIVLSVQLPGDTYNRMVLTPDDLFLSDGTWDPLTSPGLAARVTALEGGTPPAPPTGTTSFYQAITTDTMPSAGVTSRVITLPTGITDGSYALVGVMIESNAATMSAPSGWTALNNDSNGNGNATLRVFGRTVGAAQSGTSVTFTNSTSVLQAIAGGVFTGATGIDDHDIAANVATAQKNHPTPTTTSTNPSEMQVGFVGVRFSNTSGALVTAPTGSNARDSDNTASTSSNNVSLTMWDGDLRVTAGAGDLGNATTGVGAFSVGWSGVLTHA